MSGNEWDDPLDLPVEVPEPNGAGFPEPFLRHNETTTWETIEIKRGFEPISWLFEIAQVCNAYICGGYARYCCSPWDRPAKAGDVDLFPGSNDSFEELKRRLDNLGYKVKHENDVSLTYKKKEKDGYFIQIIKPVTEGRILTVGSMQEILSNFDFTVVRVGILNKEEALADNQFLADEKKRLLRFKNIHCPVSSLIRAIKYAKKGYKMRPFEAFKLFDDAMRRGPEYWEEMAILFSKGNLGEVSQQEIDKLEALLRID